MKLRAIPCYQHEVPAILEGRQTELRRPIKLPKGVAEMELVLREGKHWPRVYTGKGTLGWEWLDCPFGVPFDELWMQETWRLEMHAGFHDIGYKADGATIDAGTQYQRLANKKCWNWRPSTQMSLWASRGRLVIDDIGAERVQEITIDGAVNEGTRCHLCGGPMDASVVNDCACIDREDSVRDSFRERYDSAHAKRGYGWEKNPPVWVLKFHLKG
jgi:hypothetical protein